MKNFLARLREVALAGFLFLMPVYVIFIIVTKAWTSLSLLGTRIAAMFGLKSILGVGGSTVASALLMIVIWIACGLLVRFSFVAAFNRRVEQWMLKHIPGYASYKAMVDEKLQNEVKMLPYTSALIKQQDYWRPGYVIEQDSVGNCVVFLPDTPDTNRGQVLLVKQDQLRMVPSLSANQLDGSLKKMGKGLLAYASRTGPPMLTPDKSIR